MVIGKVKVLLRIDGASSLKDKRRIIKSILERTKSRYNISASEIDKNDVWNSAIIGIACVSNDAGYIDGLMQAIINFIESDPRIEVTDCEIDTIRLD
jgi:uncharacterized protein YlxP (DUF503 family)